VQHQDFMSRLRQDARHREADDAGAHHHAFHRRVGHGAILRDRSGRDKAWPPCVAEACASAMPPLGSARPRTTRAREVPMDASQQQRRTALLLALAQAFYLSASSVGTASSGLVGATLAPSLLLATLPYSLIPVTNALVTVPASFLMARLGRRTGFLLGASL